MKILMLKPESSNGVLPHLTEKLFQALSQLVSCEVFDAEHSQLSKSQFFDYVSNGNFNSIISLNAAGAEHHLTIPHQGEKNMFALLSGLHIGWMVDHPVYHISRLAELNPKRLVLLPSKDTIPFVEDFKLSGIFSSLPFAGGNSTDLGKDHRDRQFDIMIAASWMGLPEDISLKHQYPVSNVLSDAMAMIKEKSFLDPYYVLTEQFIDHQLQCETGAFLAQLTKDLIDYQRKLNRITLIESLVNSGLRIGLIGQGWHDYFGHRDNVVYFNNVSHTDIVHLYQESRVVVNVNAVHGASERLFDAIDAGAMVYSDFSMMLYDMFGTDHRVLFHHITDHDNSIQWLADILASQESEAWAMSAKEKILSAHTWAHRAKYLTEVVSSFSH